MLYWLRRPVVLLLIALALLGALGLYWLASRPSRAGASEGPRRPSYAQQLQQTMREVEEGM